MRRERPTDSGMNTARRPAIHAIAPPREEGVPGTRDRERAAFAVRVTGLAFAITCSQLGRVETGTNTELANTSGNRTTKPADWAASALRTVSATNAKIQLSASPKALTSATHARACRTPAWKPKPTM